MHLDAEFFPFINSLMVILRSHDSSNWCLIVLILERPFSYLISISVFDTITCVCLTWMMKMMTRVCILYKKCIYCHLLKRFFEYTNLKDIQFPEMNISLPLTLENPLNLTKTICFGTRVCYIQILKKWWETKYDKQLTKSESCILANKNLLNINQRHRHWHTHRTALLSRRHSWVLSIAINKIQLEMEQISGNF